MMYASRKYKYSRGETFRPEEDAVMAAGQKCDPGCLSYQHRYSSQSMID